MSTGERMMKRKKYQGVQRRCGGKAAEDGQSLTKQTKASKCSVHCHGGELDLNDSSSRGAGFF